MQAITPGLEAFQGDALMRLDGDTLAHIFEFLRPFGALAALSTTCKWIREACKPTMFRKCSLIGHICPYFDMDWKRRILPAAVRAHVITLSIACIFRRLGEDWMLTESNAYGKVYQPLINELALMPKLRNIILFAQEGDGIPWEALKAILAIPQVRSLSFKGLFDRRDSLPWNIRQLPLSPVAPLHRLSYRTKPYGASPSRTEVDFFVRYLQEARSQDSLEVFEMAGHCAPPELLNGACWSHLRVLSLHGWQFDVQATSTTPCDMPLVSVLGCMAALRELSLKMAHLRGTIQRYVWPPGLDTSLPWPDLESFVLSHPRAGDQICAHLPSSLRHLSLLCWPRHYIYRDRRRRETMDEYGWGSPVLTSSELLSLLSSCPTSALEQLDIEFRADYAERALLRLLGSQFPVLTVLTIHRYSDEGPDDVPVSAIGDALAALRHLRVLRIGVDTTDYSRKYDYDSEDSMAALQIPASIFARTLAPEVEMVCFLRRYSRRARFFPFRIIREDHALPNAVYEPRVSKICGISIDDEDEPPLAMSAAIEYD
ncbi:hypothetical protein OH76DRAFT_1407128 [Lentinus brumalis]|uniref:F-box domain-containing protein n=1 Tax=Lentinus brumalis TaxID=2498619 RepID=A0A371D0Z9_9APHY|nr:hypothetical protein OH76DRAFT_1407128 [Polyporus brumalis]